MTWRRHFQQISFTRNNKNETSIFPFGDVLHTMVYLYLRNRYSFMHLAKWKSFKLLMCISCITYLKWVWPDYKDNIGNSHIVMIPRVLKTDLWFGCLRITFATIGEHKLLCLFCVLVCITTVINMYKAMLRWSVNHTYISVVSITIMF